MAPWINHLYQDCQAFEYGRSPHVKGKDPWRLVQPKWTGGLPWMWDNSMLGLYGHVPYEAYPSAGLMHREGATLTYETFDPLHQTPPSSRGKEG